MQLTIDFSRVHERIFKVTMVGVKEFDLLASKIDDLVEIRELRTDGEVTSYLLITKAETPLGCHIDFDYNFPYINNDELYIGSGNLPVPKDRERIPVTKVRLSLEKVPAGMTVFTNLLESGTSGEFLIDKLDDFYLYLSRNPVIHEAKFQNVRVKWLAAPQLQSVPSVEKVRKFCADYGEFLSSTYGPYDKTEWMHMLLNPRPKNFQEILKGKGMLGGGYNCVNGIEIWTPEDPEVTGRIFGYPNYEDFIFEGLTHELGHLYTSAGHARCKSIIYASPDCPEYDRSLIGEKLNGYLHQLYMKKYYVGDLGEFLKLPQMWKQMAEARKVRHNWLDLYLFDLALRKEHQISLPKLFRAMIQRKLKERTPFSSLDFLYEILEKDLGVRPSAETREIIAPETRPDYSKYDFTAKDFSFP